MYCALEIPWKSVLWGWKPVSERYGVGSHLVKNWYSPAGICEINKLEN